MIARSRVPQVSASGRRSPLASNSLSEHLLRGIAGLVVAALAVSLTALVGPVALLLLILTAIVWRGCPTCWAVGLIGTMADARARRGCSRCGDVAHTELQRSVWD